MDISPNTRLITKLKINDTNFEIATRIDVYPIVERECGSLRPIQKTDSTISIYYTKTDSI